jgi:predicted metal-dependent peptidase
MLMIGKTLSEEQRLTKAIADIIGNQNYIALAGILMMGDHKIVKTGEMGCRTAMTNGVNAWYAREFVAGLSDAEFRFLILHEAYHVLYKHLTTYRHLYEENRFKANLACDYVINLKLMDFDKATDRGFIAMPKVGVIDEQYRGLDSAQVYKLLPDDPSGGGSGKGKGSGQGQAGDGDGSGETLDQHDWDGADELSPDEKKEIERAIDEAIRQGALIAGKMGSGGARLLDDVLESKIDWREMLREFVSTTCSGNDYSTWRRPNRRYISAGVYLPSGISETVGELVIAIDTSGSIGGRELSQFLGEVSAIAKAVKPQAVRLLYWDTQVCRDEYYTQDKLDDIVKSTKPAGGGGTMVECVPEYLREKQIKPQAVIVLTDGYLGGSWGTWNCPTLWCILDNKNTTSAVGKTVHIDSSRM